MIQQENLAVCHQLGDCVKKVMLDLELMKLGCHGTGEELEVEGEAGGE